MEKGATPHDSCLLLGNREIHPQFHNCRAKIINFFFLIAILQDAEERQLTGHTAADSFSQSFSEKRDAAGVVALHGFDC